MKYPILPRQQAASIKEVVERQAADALKMPDLKKQVEEAKRFLAKQSPLVRRTLAGQFRYPKEPRS